MKRIGLVGTALTALCCFTPLLVILFGLAGITSWLMYADFILLPLLAFFVAFTLFAFLRKRRG